MFKTSTSSKFNLNINQPRCPLGDANSKRTDDDGSSRLFSPRSLDVSETEDKKTRHPAMSKLWTNIKTSRVVFLTLDFGGKHEYTKYDHKNKTRTWACFNWFVLGSERSSFCIIMQPLTKAFGWKKLCNHPWPEWAKHRPRRIDTHHPQLVPCDIIQMSGALRSRTLCEVQLILLMEEILHRDVSKNLWIVGYLPYQLVQDFFHQQ